MTGILSVAVAIASILLIGNALIVAHELGHYLAARAAGITAKRFVIGMGPVLWRRTDRRGTVWSFAALPVGGFVQFPGEQEADLAGGYAARPPLARMAIILAGPATNLALAFLIYAALFGAAGLPAILPIVSSIAPGSAAEQAGFREGDRIVAVDGQPVVTFEDMRPTLQAGAGRVLDIDIERGGEPMHLTPLLGSIEKDGQQVGYLGIWSRQSAVVPATPAATIAAAATETWRAMTDTVGGIYQALATGQGTENFTGVLGIAQLAGEAAQAGNRSIFILIAILSANLALMNMLPIPVLDGGAFLFCMAEWVRGRPASARLTEFATRSGIAAIAAVFMLSMLHDLAGFGLFRLFGR